MSNYAGTYALDSTHSRIGFWLRHAMVTKVHGEFTDYESNIVIGEDSSATAVIKTASIDTKNADRDAHIKGEDFFDVAKFPEMTFTATDFNIAGNAGTVTGDLTIKGITKPVTLDVEIFGEAVDPYDQTRVGFEATTKINRKDFGIDFNAPLGTGGVLLSEDINIVIEGSAIRQG
ncbi:YceI family protein [Corynebacterium sp. H127]|uniref:YceI family protein n=1 Tax=Corynebacterium sp. H127 TaxID=3133418 RepID=UPI0030AFE78A